MHSITCWHPLVLGDNGFAPLGHSSFGHAASAVTVQAHTRVTVSVAFGALVNCVSYRLNLSALSLCSLVESELAEFLVTGYQSSIHGLFPARSVLGKLFPGVEVDFENSYILLADILEAVVWASGCSLAGGKLYIQDVLWDSGIVHPAHVSQPSEAALMEKSDHAGNLCTLQYIIVGRVVAP